jgi:hypothetical protein
MLAAQLLYTCGDEAVDKVVAGARIGRQSHDFFPLTAGIACLLAQFATSRLLGVLALFAHSGTQLDRSLADAVTVLADENELAVAPDCDYIYPIGVFKDVIFIVDSPCGQFHDIAPSREPRTFYQVLALRVSHFLSLSAISTNICAKLQKHFPMLVSFMLFSTFVCQTKVNMEEHKEWYAIRVTYNREMKVKEELDSMSIENFIPMHYRAIERDGKLVEAP